MTENELLIEVSKFYKGYLTVEKAIKLYEFEHGTTPEITSNKQYVNTDFLETFELEYINEETFMYMKDLQESGVCNMITESAQYIQSNLLLERTEVNTVLKIYMHHYTTIYYPEELI